MSVFATQFIKVFSSARVFNDECTFVCREEEDLDTKADIKIEERSSEDDMISESHRINTEPILKLESKPDRNLQSQHVSFFSVKYKQKYLIQI